ncbi:MAG: methionyl-tRNA formyltransferase [Holosporaceae bacterium]|jgi:methionyl-tRNA formyltransferase|nr:methionyl-tRNA formyltransferase [Holosporaceae bacterium]
MKSVNNVDSIVFMGTSDFSLKALVAIREAGFNVVRVYTQTPKPAGRGYAIQKSVVYKYAEASGIPIHCPKNFKSVEEVERFRSIGANVAVVAAYGLIIPQVLLDIPPRGFINIHASKLPRWRGAAPIPAAILAGDTVTGITIMKMDAGVDTGDIITMGDLYINPEMSSGQLSQELSDLGAAKIVETLKKLDFSLLSARKQSEKDVTYAPKITKESCRIDWMHSAEDIRRTIKAFSPEPGAWTEIKGHRLKIFDAEVAVAEIDKNDYESRNLCHSEILHENSAAGLILDAAKFFCVDKPVHLSGMLAFCGKGVLRLLDVQLAGKKRMSGDAFIRGRRDLVGQVAG